VCHVRGEKWLFVDLALSPTEQLAHVRESLEMDLATNRRAA
jgi:hypothetical protein